MIGTYCVGVIPKGSHDPVPLCVCTGLVNAVNATTVLSRCFPGNPGRARYWKAGKDTPEIPDPASLGFAGEELAEIRKALDTIGRHYQ